MRNLRKNEAMKRHTSFHIGGPADTFAEPENADELLELISKLEALGEPYMVMGNGSNLLFGDGGFRGTVICLGKAMSGITVRGSEIHAEAGALLSQVAAAALENGLTGLEFASGIPGSVGGAVVMNAGAYGGEMKDVLSEVEIIEMDGSICTVYPEELELGYRSSNVAALSRIVLGAVFRLEEGDKDEIAARMKELNAKRREKQPLEYPSAGSAFKRPEGYFAGKLIEDAGLKGFSVGDAQVSEKHAGFIINRGEATAADVEALIREIQKRVYENSGVMLEPEIRMTGEAELPGEERS